MADFQFESDDEDIESLLEQSENILFLSHFQCELVQEAKNNTYFVCSSVGKGEVRLYMKTAQTLLRHLHRAYPIAKKLLKLQKKRKLPDKDYFQEVVDKNTDKKTQVDYELRLIVSIYMGKVCLFLRSFYYIKEEERFQATKKAVEFAIIDKEFENFKNFIMTKASPTSTHDAQTEKDFPDDVDESNNDVDDDDIMDIRQGPSRSSGGGGSNSIKRIKGGGGSSGRSKNGKKQEK